MDSADREGALHVPLAVFVAYNANVIEDLKGAWSGSQIKLTWIEQTQLKYQIHRGQNGTLEKWALVTGANYDDATVNWQPAYQYAVSTVAEFQNPFTQETIALEGAKSQIVEIPPLSPIAISIQDAKKVAPTQYETVSDSANQIVINGQCQNVATEIELSVQSDQAKQAQPKLETNGTFRFIVPAQLAIWTIQCQDKAWPDHNQTIQLKVQADQTPPQIDLTNLPNSTITEDDVALSGKVSDDFSKLIKISIQSDRFPDNQFEILQLEEGGFQAEILLDYGDNQIIVTATDQAGNTALKTLTLTRSSSQRPEIRINPYPATITTDVMQLEGLVYSTLASEKIRLDFNNRLQFPQPTDKLGQYQFRFDQVKLNPGFNTLTIIAESYLGKESSTLNINYQPITQVSNEASPVITVNTTDKDGYLQTPVVTIQGRVESSNGLKSLTIAAKPVAMSEWDKQAVNFSEVIQLTELFNNDQVAEVTIIAIDIADHQTIKKLHFQYDNAAPQIQFVNAVLQPSPAINQVTENPYSLKLQIIDNDLSFVTMNQALIDLNNTADPQSYILSQSLNLNDQNEFTIEAWDKAGNHQSLSLIFEYISNVTLQIATPAESVDLIQSSEPAILPVTVYYNGLPENGTITVQVNAQDAVTMKQDSGAASATMTFQTGENQIIVAALDADQTILARTTKTIALNLEEISKALLTGYEPTNNQDNVKPNQALIFDFSQKINSNLLQIEVKQTVHGKTYQTNKQASLLPKMPKIVDTHKDLESVNGKLSILPYGHQVSFQPEVEFEYNATVYVKVTYDGQELTRFIFNTRPLPTLVGGFLKDQLNAGVAGVTVRIPELNAETLSGNDGRFNFNLNINADEDVHFGKYTITYNGGQNNPRYSAVEQLIFLERERLTQIGVVRIPLRNPDEPYRHIYSGQAEAILQNNHLQLDLSEAELLFPDNRSQGSIHVQFLSYRDIPNPYPMVLSPHWIYSIQPAVSVYGSIGIKIKIPQTSGGLNYKQPDGTYTVLLGYDEQRKYIQPIGIGEIQQDYIVSVNKIPLKRLDYIGYALIENKAQDALRKIVIGEMDISAIINVLELLYQ